MTFAEEIARLRKAVAGCRALVFGDLSTRTVLCAAAAPDLRQEDHDALLTDAARIFGPGACRLLGLALAPELPGPAAQPQRALILRPGEVRLFQAWGNVETEVVCVRCQDLDSLHEVDAQLTRLADTHG